MRLTRIVVPISRVAAALRQKTPQTLCLKWRLNWSYIYVKGSAANGSCRNLSCIGRKTASPVVFLAKHRRRPEIDNPRADDCLMITECQHNARFYAAFEVMVHILPGYWLGVTQRLAPNIATTCALPCDLIPERVSSVLAAFCPVWNID